MVNVPMTRRLSKTMSGIPINTRTRVRVSNPKKRTVFSTIARNAQGSQGRRSNFHFPAAASQLGVNRAYSFFLSPIPFSSRVSSSIRPFPFASRLADRKISREPHEWSLSAIK